MKIIRGIDNLKPEDKNCVATIGNFDGVHPGHQALLKKLLRKAGELNLPPTVIIFEPQPNEYFNPNKSPPRLMRLREKLQALSACHIERILILPFSKQFADMSAEQFIEKILVEKLAVKYLIVGDDFKFGRERLGNFAMLQAFGKQLGFIVEEMPTFTLENERVSSTRIRLALEKGDLKLTQKLLGHPFRMSGRVAHGDKRGRIIGFPTANIYLHRRSVPIAGVYAVRVYGIENKIINGVANVGTRPTVDGSRSLLEVHLFDFNKNIYGRHVEVEFVSKIRDEKKYESFELLKLQIFKDAQQAREIFKDCP